MILETLRGIRSKNIAQRSQENVQEGDELSVRESVQSTVPSSLASSPGGRSTKRYSNNLFGSGRFRDYTYMRSVAKNGSIRTQSLTPTESSQNYNGNTSSATDSVRPVTPENTDTSASPQSSPGQEDSIPSSDLSSVPYDAQPMSIIEYRLSKTLGASALKRASLALENAIKEMEEEAEDEIVMPRSTPIPQTPVEQSPQVHEVQVGILVRRRQLWNAYRFPLGWFPFISGVHDRSWYGNIIRQTGP